MIFRIGKPVNPPISSETRLWVGHQPGPGRPGPESLSAALSSPIGAESFVLSGVSELTATGCAFNFISLHGACASVNAEFDWVAIGN